MLDKTSGADAKNTQHTAAWAKNPRVVCSSRPLQGSHRESVKSPRMAASNLPRRIVKETQRLLAEPGKCMRA